MESKSSFAIGRADPQQTEYVGYTEFRYTLDQVKQLAEFYMCNEQSISKTLMCSEEVFTRGKDAFSIVRIIEDIDHIRRGEPCEGGLRFIGNEEVERLWIKAIQLIVAP